MDRIHEFDPVIYPRLLWIVVNPKKEVLEDLFEGNFNQEDDSLAIVYQTIRKKPDKRCGCLIVFNSKKYMTTEVIAHEATHVALDIFSYLGIECDGQHQEALAYFIGWVAKCCEQVKRNKYD